MKTIEDRAKRITIDNLDLSYIMSERPEVRRRCIEVAVQTAYVKGYKEAEPKWISVDDRLPEQFGVYLVYPHKYSRTACFTTSGISEIPKNSWYIDDENGYESEVYVSHWMPIPKDPKGEE